jgi:hypothetical protein
MTPGHTEVKRWGDKKILRLCSSYFLLLINVCTGTECLYFFKTKIKGHARRKTRTKNRTKEKNAILTLMTFFASSVN